MFYHQVIIQRGAGDCGTAALAMLLSEQGVSYDDVLLAVGRLDRYAGMKGLYLKQLILAARHFGITLRRRFVYNLEETPAGLLNVKWKWRKGLNHVVLVRDGLLTDPTDGTIWEASAFLQVRKARAMCLLEMIE